MPERFLPGFVKSHRRRKERIAQLKAKLNETAHSPSNSEDGFVHDVARGTALDTALTNTVDRLYLRNRHEANTFSQALVKPSEGRGYPAARGLYLYKAGHLDSAYRYFALDPDAAVRACPEAFTDAMLHVEGPNAVHRVMAMAEQFGVDEEFVSAMACMRSLLRKGYRSEAKIIVESLPEAETLKDYLGETDMVEVEWFRKIVAERANPIALEDCDLVFGLMDYKLLSRDRSSSNAGDYVQTLAALGHLVRRKNVEFYSSDPELQASVRAFAARVPERCRIGGGKTVRVGIVPVDRDYASGRDYRQPVWMISNGWFMHANGRGRFDFPFPDAIRPIFVSFHVNKPDLLTPQAVDYLKRMEPIGCRDWTTVYQLLDHGVDAFFSGCLTTTVGLVFKDKGNKRGRGVANVEASLSGHEQLGRRVEEFTQMHNEVRGYSLAEGLRAADEMLDRYRDFDTIYTSRLHCYLACRSLGLDVTFRPKRNSDIRFEGLAPLDDEAFGRMRSALEERLAQVLGEILAGRPEGEVRTLWADLCANDVASARHRLAEEPPLPETTIDISTITDRMTSSRWTFGPDATTHCNHYAFAADHALLSQLRVVIHSLKRAASGPVALTLLLRDIDRDEVSQISRDWPEAAIQAFDCSQITYPDVHLLAHTSVATLDRLFLPKLLPSVRRLLYVDVDVLIRHDPALLFDIDMGEHPIAGRATTSATWQTGLAHLEMKARKWRDNVHLARRMWRWAYATGHVAFRAINAGVLLMDPSRLNEDSFTEKTLAMVEAFGFHDQDAINFYLRSRHTLLNQTWNTIPSQDYCDDPAIVHWAGPSKPWQSHYVLFKEEYEKLVGDLFDERSHI